MGERGRRRAKVIERYVSLWNRLRNLDVPRPSRCVPRSLELSHARMFSSFPKATLKRHARVRGTKAGAKVLRGEDFPVIYAGLDHLVSMDVLRPLLFFARKPGTIAAIKEKLGAMNPPPDPRRIDFCIHWAVKHGLLEIVEHSSP